MGINVNRIEKIILALGIFMALLIFLNTLITFPQNRPNIKNNTNIGARLVVLKEKIDAQIPTPYNFSLQNTSLKSEGESVEDGVWFSWYVNSSDHLSIDGKKHAYVLSAWDRMSNQSERPNIFITSVRVTNASKYSIFISSKKINTLLGLSLHFEVIQEDRGLLLRSVEVKFPL